MKRTIVTLVVMLIAPLGFAQTSSTQKTGPQGQTLCGGRNQHPIRSS